MRLELVCETCGSRIADPPTIPNDRPVLVCCKATLAKAKAIADALNLEHETVKKTCQRMFADEQLGTDGTGTYHYVSPASPVSPEGHEGHKGQA